MSSLRGVAVGFLSLTALQAVVSDRNASGRIGELARGVSGLIQAVLDPRRPAIPDLREKAKAEAEAKANPPITLAPGPLGAAPKPPPKVTA